MSSDERAILTTGTSVSPGLATGRARLLTGAADAAAVRDGEIAVVRDSNPIFAVGVMRSAGLVCERGGAFSHICIVAMEMGIPCIVGAADACRLLKDGSTVTLDATEGVVYGWESTGPQESEQS